MSLLEDGVLGTSGARHAWLAGRRWCSSPQLGVSPACLQSNARFAASIEPDNPALRERIAEVDELRRRGQPTVPSLLGQEFAANPFLRPDDPVIRASLGVPPTASSAEAFGAIRAAKDSFR